MHTHDLENHDNLYADEGTMVIGETRADAQSHAYWAVGAIALMVVGLGVALVISLSPRKRSRKQGRGTGPHSRTQSPVFLCRCQADIRSGWTAPLRQISR